MVRTSSEPEALLREKSTGSSPDATAGESMGDLLEAPHTVHVASFRDLPRAESYAQILEQNGFQALQIIPVELNGSGRWHRVMVGRYDGRRSAHEAAREYIAAGTFQFAQPVLLEDSRKNDLAFGFEAGDLNSDEGARYE